MRLIFLTIFFSSSFLTFSQNEFLLPVQEITEINPAVIFHYMKPAHIRLGIIGEFSYFNFMTPVLYNQHRFNLNVQYQSSYWKNKNLNNNVLSLNIGREIRFTRKSSFGIGAKVKGYNLSKEATLSSDLGFIYFREKILFSYTLMNPLSLGNMVVEPTHNFYANARFHINIESGKKSDFLAKIQVEPILMTTVNS